MKKEVNKDLWLIFCGSALMIGFLALILIWVGNKVYLSIRKQQKKFEEDIKEKENKEHEG